MDLVLDSADRLDLVGVSLSAVLVVVSVLSLVSVSLQDVLVATVTGELVAHPANGGEGENILKQAPALNLGTCRSERVSLYSTC